MSRIERTRLSRVGVITALFVVVSLNSPPTIPSVPVDRPAPPSSSEVTALSELSDWVFGQTTRTGFDAFPEQTLASAVESRKRGFDLFRDFYADETKQAEFLRSIPFGRLIGEVSARHDLDPFLVAAVVEAESNFHPDALSVDGAIGLMQVIPSTVDLISPGSDATDPATNLRIGSRYLRLLLDEFDGEIPLALAAYNAGPGKVQRYDGIPPYRETRTYVNRVLTHYVDHHQELWRNAPAQQWFFLR